MSDAGRDTDGAGGSGDGPDGKLDLSAMKKAIAEGRAAADSASGGEASDHVFWSSQPVPRMDEPDLGPDDPCGPIVPSDVSAVPTEPLKLPAGFEWASVRLSDEPELCELYTLLRENYVEDSQAMFRFEYSKPFIQWAMMPPGFKHEWHVGVRVSSSCKLVAFIGATPAELCIHGQRISGCEVNFLCVHKKLRTKRLAPVLIREVTRRCNLDGVFQAAYTAGVVIPKPIGRCQCAARPAARAAPRPAAPARQRSAPPSPPPRLTTLPALALARCAPQVLAPLAQPQEADRRRLLVARPAQHAQPARQDAPAARGAADARLPRAEARGRARLLQAPQRAAQGARGARSLPRAPAAREGSGQRGGDHEAAY